MPTSQCFFFFFFLGHKSTEHFLLWCVETPIQLSRPVRAPAADTPDRSCDCEISLISAQETQQEQLLDWKPTGDAAGERDRSKNVRFEMCTVCRVVGLLTLAFLYFSAPVMVRAILF